MQVFLPYPDDLIKSAQSLDDIRLNKSITECNQILLTYVNNGGGHSNHPVNVWYKSSQGIFYILKYLYRLCDEYGTRFNKSHMGYFTYCGMCDCFLHDEFNDEHYPCKDTYGDNPNFQPAYIKGVKGVNQIITTENVGELYQKLLCAKWDSDKVKPKWTNRDKPEFYNHEVGHND